MKMVYNVPDVEHMGDVSSEENYLRKMGAEILDVDVTWGSEEIEEALIYIEVKKEDIKKFLNYGIYKA